MIGPNQVIDANLNFHGIFEKESIYYAVGDKETKAGKREAQVFAYNQTSDNSRKLIKTLNNLWLIFEKLFISKLF
jgi:hypothetical protein